VVAISADSSASKICGDDPRAISTLLLQEHENKDSALMTQEDCKVDECLGSAYSPPPECREKLRARFARTQTIQKAKMELRDRSVLMTGVV
jgi:hypothetical protein